MKTLTTLAAFLAATAASYGLPASWSYDFVRDGATITTDDSLMKSEISFDHEANGTGFDIKLFGTSSDFAQWGAGSDHLGYEQDFDNSGFNTVVDADDNGSEEVFIDFVLDDMTPAMVDMGPDGLELYTGSSSIMVEASVNDGSYQAMTVSAGGDNLFEDAMNVQSISIRPASGSTNAFGIETMDFTDVSAVPEPSTYAAIAGVLALGLTLYRRRRQ